MQLLKLEYYLWAKFRSYRLSTEITDSGIDRQFCLAVQVML